MNISIPREQFRSFIPLIENFLVAESKQTFIATLPKDSSDAAFMQLCTENLSWNQESTVLNRLGLDHNAKTQIIKLKTLSILLDVKSSQQDKKLAIEYVQRVLNLHFDHAKPTSDTYNAEQGTNNSNLPSELKDEDYSLLKFLEKNNYEGVFNNLTSYGISTLQKGRFFNLREIDFDSVIRQLNFATLGDQGVEIIAKYFEFKKQINKNFVLPADIFTRLTAQQLESLGKLVKDVLLSRDYLQMRYRKTIGHEMKVQLPEVNNKLLTKEQLEAKKKLLIKGIDWLKQFKHQTLQSFIDQLTIQILTINILLEKPELDYFLEYMKRPRVMIATFSNEYRQALNTNRQHYTFDNFWFRAHGLATQIWPNDQNLVNSYLQLYFRLNSDYKSTRQFEKFFDTGYLNKILYRVRLEKGEDTPDIQTVFNKTEEANMKTRKQLTISERNKRSYAVSENISLSLMVKNIAEITAEIYQISTQKHYLSSTKEIDNSIGLEFLEPLKKVTKKIDNSNPFRVNEVQFSLTEYLEAKNSIYIVDFHGEGILSRAVIRRGSIVCVKRHTLAGLQLRFFQEGGLAINEIDIWLRGRKVQVKDKYTIPYGQKAENLNIIALKDGYAELVKLVVDQQNYSWSVNYTYHEENFLVGSKAKILIHAKLSSLSGPLNVQALKDSNILVNIVNHLGIPSSLSLKGIKWDNRNSYELEIPVQTYLKQINITVSAKVDKYIGKPQQLTSTKTIKFRQEQQELLTFVEFFLSYTTQGYILKLLGKNGQPKPFVTVNIEIYTKLFNGSVISICMTDKNGEVRLGNLEDVLRIQVNNIATSDIQSTYGFWNLNTINYEICVKDELIIEQNEEFSIPTYKGFKFDQDVSLLQYNIDCITEVISNQTNRLKLKNNKIIASLPKGCYVLSFPRIQKQVRITVTKLEKWGNSQLQIDNNKRVIYSLPANTKDTVSLPSQFSKNDQGNSYKVTLKLQVEDKAKLDNVRVHVLASSFVYKTNYSQDITQTVGQGRGTQPIRLKDNICAYLNNKQLSDEHCYILNRQKEDKFIGNNLERPRVLLKRTFNRDTTVEKEILAGQKQFRTVDAQQHLMATNLMRQNISRDCMPGGFARCMAPQVYQDGISLFNSFLSNPSLVISNLHGETIQFSLPKIYQSFVVIVASPSFAIEKLYSLDPITIQTTNQVSSGLKESNDKEAYTISRECYKLQQGETLKVKRSSQWTPVSSTNLATLSDISNSSLYEWVMNWTTYTQEKKLKVYDESVCHELNTFIKYKDEEFFNKVVKSHIINKLEKGVVDYCLLNDKEAYKYSTPEKLVKLNPFEKCLVVEYLVKNGNGDKAKSISDAMALEYKSYKVPYSQFERKFDVVMTSKQTTPPPQQFQQACMSQAVQQRCYMQTQSIQKQSLRYTDTRSDEVQRGFRGGVHNKKKNATRSRVAMKQQEAQDDGEFQLQQSIRQQFKAGFKEVQKTKQYVQTTYYEMKQPQQSTHHIPLTKFWVQLATFFVNPTNVFISDSFIYLTSRCQISLAITFLPLPMAAKYSIKAEGQFVIITAQSAFMVFVKEVKSMQFHNKYGILINQRISDPSDEFTYEEDGTTLQKSVEEFIKDKPYYLHTVITNTSTANLQLQVLIDLPEGSIPIGSNQYTQVNSQIIGMYETKAFKRAFYFPKSGSYNAYPANASKNRQVISRANVLNRIEVKEQRIVKKLETLNDVLISGSKSDILEFLKNKNIFDGTTFNAFSILWLLKEKEMYNDVLSIFRGRSFFHREVWQFGFFHNDSNTIKEYIEADFIQNTPYNLRVFEYHPLTSQRAHKFMKSEKSTILNETFKQTYENFLLSSIFNGTTNTPLFLTVFTYYLILQDRIKQASLVFKTLSKLKQQPNFPRLQYDYLSCFVDMYTGYPNFVKARETSSKYVNYPVGTWQKLFKDVDILLNTHDSTVYIEQQTQSHDIKISIKGNQLSVNLPLKTTVELNFHAVNLELMFSNSPFDEVKLFSTVRPFKSIVLTSDKGGEQLVDRPEGFADIYVNPIESSSTKQGQQLSSFLWPNDCVKAKILEDEGVAIVFVDGKPRPGVYCKVYAKGKETRFYKDGYTDIQGRFKYVSQLDDVDRFSLLFVTDKGGVTKMARKPTTGGTL